MPNTSARHNASLDTADGRSALDVLARDFGQETGGCVRCPGAAPRDRVLDAGAAEGCVADACVAGVVDVEDAAAGGSGSGCGCDCFGHGFEDVAFD